MTQIFCDGVADAVGLKIILDNLPFIAGFTTNPTLMRKVNVKNYELWAKELLSATTLPISFEVISDEIHVMQRQAETLASWGKNVYVKIPIMTTSGYPTLNLIRTLGQEGIKVNVTAICTGNQVEALLPYLSTSTPSYVSVFAGRIADTGVDPIPTMLRCRMMLERVQPAQLIWASPREAYNIHQAQRMACDIITATPDLIDKYVTLGGKNLTDFSRDTVQMFYRDAVAAGYTL